MYVFLYGLKVIVANELFLKYQFGQNEPFYLFIGQNEPFYLFIGQNDETIYY